MGNIPSTNGIRNLPVDDMGVSVKCLWAKLVEEGEGFLEKFPSLTTEILQLTAVAFNVRCGRPSKKAQVDPQKKQEEIAAKNTQPC